MFEGGFGFSPEVVAKMSLDTIIFLLTQSTKRKTTTQMPSGASLADEQGLVKGRDSEGKTIQLPWNGKSLAKRIKDGEVAFDEQGRKIEVPKKVETPREARIRKRQEQQRRKELEKLIASNS